MAVLAPEEAGAAAEAGAAGACTASAPCFSPPMSTLSPPFMITKIAKAAKMINPTKIFNIWFLLV